MLRGDPIRNVRELRTRPGRELQIHGSARLGKALLTAGSSTHSGSPSPTVTGSGRRLLDHPSAAVGLRLARHEVTVKRLLLLEYERAGAAPVAEYEDVTAFV